MDGERKGPALVVGLGNPGIEYQFTPHNAGFLAIDRLAEQGGVAVTNRRCRALTATTRIAGRDVVLAKPETYMNLSGISVRELLGKYELEPQDLLVIFDERDLPWGMIRIGERGRPGTHNGAKSVTSAVGTQEFARLRLGCGPDHPVGDLAAYVLRPMKKAELEVAAEMVASAADAVELLLTQGIAAAMNKYNRRVPPEEAK